MVITVIGHRMSQFESMQSIAKWQVDTICDFALHMTCSNLFKSCDLRSPTKWLDFPCFRGSEILQNSSQKSLAAVGRRAASVHRQRNHGVGVERPQVRHSCAAAVVIGCWCQATFWWTPSKWRQCVPHQRGLGTWDEMGWAWEELGSLLKWGCARTMMMPSWSRTRFCILAQLDWKILEGLLPVSRKIQTNWIPLGHSMTFKVGQHQLIEADKAETRQPGGRWNSRSLDVTKLQKCGRCMWGL